MSKEESEETKIAGERTSDDLKEKQFAASSKETKLDYEGKLPTKVFPAKTDAGGSKSKTFLPSEQGGPGSTEWDLSMLDSDELSSDELSSDEEEFQMYVKSTSIKAGSKTDMDAVKSSCERICGDESPRILKYLEENPVLLETCQDPHLRDVIIYVLLKNPETKFTRLTEILVTMVTMYLESGELEGQKFDLEVLAKYSNNHSPLSPLPSSGLDVFGREWFDKSANFKFSILQQTRKGLKFNHQMFRELFQALHAHVYDSASEYEPHLYRRFKFGLMFDEFEINSVQKFITGFHNPSIAQQLAKLCNHAPRDESEKTQIIQTYIEREIAEPSNLAFELLYELNDPIMTKSASIPTRIILRDPSLAALHMTSSMIAQSNKTHRLEIFRGSGDEIIGPVVTCLHQVDQLVLRGCGITSKGMERLSSTIQQRDTPMKRVKLHGNDTSRESGEHIAGCLHNIEDYQDVVWSSRYQQADGSNVVERTIEQLEQLDEYMFTNESSSSVGSGGARLEVGGCVVDIPPDALDHQVHIKLTSYYGKNEGESESITPMLKCEPHGLRFLKPVRITLPTCYVTEDDQSAQVVVRTSMNRWDWKDFATIMYRNDLRISFDTRHFSFFKIFSWLQFFSKNKSIVFRKPSCFLHKTSLAVKLSLVFADYGQEDTKQTDIYHSTVKIGINDDIDFELKAANDDLQPDPDYVINEGNVNMTHNSLRDEFNFKIIKDTQLYPNQFSTGIGCLVKNAENQLLNRWICVVVDPADIPEHSRTQRSGDSPTRNESVNQSGGSSTQGRVATAGSSVQLEDVPSPTTPKRVATTVDSVDLSSPTTPKQVVTADVITDEASDVITDVTADDSTSTQSLALVERDQIIDLVQQSGLSQTDLARITNLQPGTSAVSNIQFQKIHIDKLVINQPSSSRQDVSSLGALTYPPAEPLSPERQKLDKGTLGSRAMDGLEMWRQKNPSKSAQDLVELLKENELMLMADEAEEALQQIEDSLQPRSTEDDSAAREDSEEEGDANDPD